MIIINFALKFITTIGYIIIFLILGFIRVVNNIFSKFYSRVREVGSVLFANAKEDLVDISKAFIPSGYTVPSIPSVKYSLPKLGIFSSIKKIDFPKFRFPTFNLAKILRNIFTKLSIFLSKIKFKKKIRTESSKGEKTQGKQLSLIEVRPHRIRWFFFGIIFAFIFGFIPYIVYTWYLELPNPDLLVTNTLSKSTKIYDRSGVLLYEIYIDKSYSPVELEKIPQSVINATISVEDSLFYYHKGFRFDAFVRAAKATFLEQNIQGGSTITQQLVKNALLSPEQTISRKLKELALSLMVETKYSKEEILEMYLNNIAYGGNAWGVQTASKKYFGKDVWELNLAESAMLAGLPSAPSTYNPFIDPSLAKERQRYVLDRMVSLGYISQEDSDVAYTTKLEFATQTEYMRAPHFVNYVIKTLEERYGRRYVELGGLTVNTSLDLELQDKVQSIVKEEIDANAWRGISNGAAVVLSPKTGEILAYVGSLDYNTPTWGAYDVVTAYRQPGSSIKPVTYALALAGGYTPASIIEDKAVVFKFQGAESYKPVNYDGKYHGKVTLRSALANSYNIPAVKLAHDMGPDNIVTLGKSMGLTNWNVDGSYGLSITLGGKEVRLLDHANVYATFARGGEFMDTTPFISVKNDKGFDIGVNNLVRKRVLSNEVSYLIWDILSDNNARLPAFGTNNSLTLPNKRIAVKTGTTDSIKDNWTMGYTPSYVVGVWVGNNDNTPMNRYLTSGITGAAPIWNRVFSEVLKNKEDEQMLKPEGIFQKFDEDCKRSELFIKGSNVPEHLCVIERDDDKDEKD